MKIDFSQVLKTPKGEPLKNEKGEPLTLEEAVYPLGAVSYQGQNPDEKVKLARISVKIVKGEELKSEDVSVLKSAAKAVYNGFAIIAIEDALEG
jgi:RNase P/RNase MRP subunit p30